MAGLGHAHHQRGLHCWVARSYFCLPDRLVSLTRIGRDASHSKRSSRWIAQKTFLQTSSCFRDHVRAQRLCEPAQKRSDKQAIRCRDLIKDPEAFDSKYQEQCIEFDSNQEWFWRKKSEKEREKIHRICCEGSGEQSDLHHVWNRKLL